jgi:AcrR family transcriptional regulator
MERLVASSVRAKIHTFQKVYIWARRIAERTVRRTKAEAEQTREAVLAAAVQVFLERGVARATFYDIARVAGVTRGAIYWHFRDKLEIFSALEERISLPNVAVSTALKSRLASHPGLDPLDELARAIRETLQELDEDPARRQILTILWQRCEYVEEMLPALQRLQRADAALREQFAGIMTLAAERGRLAPGRSPEIAARALLLLINGSIEDWLRAPGEVQLVADTMSLVAAFLDAVSASVAPGADRPVQLRSTAANSP